MNLDVVKKPRCGGFCEWGLVQGEANLTKVRFCAFCANFEITWDWDHRKPWNHLTAVSETEKLGAAGLNVHITHSVCE